MPSTSYRMPQWSDAEGEEAQTIENEWICVTLVTPLQFPQNLWRKNKFKPKLKAVPCI